MKLFNSVCAIIMSLGLSLNYLVLVSSDSDRAIKALGLPITVLAQAAVLKMFEDNEGEDES
jgi:hypothetical protein